MLDAVRELDFIPKEVATSRARRAARRIGVLAPFSSYSSFSQRLNGVMTATSGTAVEIVVFDVRSAEQSTQLLESLPALRSLDGLIVMSVPFGERVAQALRSGKLPAVLVELAGHGFPAVLVDDRAGGELAARAFLDSGRSRLAFLGHRQLMAEFDSPSRRRHEGFEAAAFERGVSIDPSMVLLLENDFETARRAAHVLLSRHDRPDAVFAHTDDLAAATYRAAISLGLRVPHDVAIVGFDDGPIARALDLPSIRQPLTETGAWAARTLLGLIADPEASAPSVTLPVDLVRGELL